MGRGGGAKCAERIFARELEQSNQAQNKEMGRGAKCTRIFARERSNKAHGGKKLRRGGAKCDKRILARPEQSD